MNGDGSNMKKIFSFRSIRSKIIGGFSIVIALLIVLTTLNVIEFISANTMMEDIVEEELELLIADEIINTKNVQRLAAARGYLLTGDDQYKVDFDRYTEEALEARELVAASTTSDRMTDLLDNTAVWRQIVVDEVFTAYDRGDEAGALQVLREKAVPISDELLEGFQEIVEARQDSIRDLGRKNIAEGERMLILTIVLALIIIVLSVVISIVVSGNITKPIIRVMNRMKLIASGDLANEPLEVKTQDETGELTIATNEMSDRMRNILNQIQLVSETVSSQSEELTQSANEVMNGSEQVAATMQEIASGSESQANNASDLSTKMNIFTKNIHQANDHGHHIQQASEDIVQMTGKGSDLMNSSMEEMRKIDETVQQAVERVEGLDKHTQEISELVSVIRDIADQTNLLALNAAIEAARAGEQGKGFAVVADEVRKLAEESSNSVTNITNIVDQIQSESSAVVASLKAGYQDVTNGTEQVSTTGETFEIIREAVSKTVKEINQLSDNLNDLAENNEQMNEGIQEIAAISEESAAGVEQTSASAQQTSSAMQEVSASSDQLSKLAEELNELINEFKI